VGSISIATVSTTVLEVSPVSIQKVLLAAVAALVLAAPPVASADAQGTPSERDAAEIKAYRLTMGDVRKLAAAGEALNRAIANDPRYKAEQALKQEIAALEKRDNLSDAELKRVDELQTKLQEMQDKNDQGNKSAESLDEMARQIESEPVMANAIKGAGMTPRQYSLVMIVTAQSMMAHGFQKSNAGKPLPKEVANAVLADNVKLVGDNEAEIERLMDKLKTLEKKP
jgi:hypothetical protein